jgi:hypothetical protein
MKDMRKAIAGGVEIKRSVEGGMYETVILDKVLVDALYHHRTANDTFVYLLITKSIISPADAVYDKLVKIIADSEEVFRSYGLDKYDVRANYLFESSVQVK